MHKYHFILIALFFISETYAQGKIDGFYKEAGSGSAVLGLGFEDTQNYYIGRDRSDLGRNAYYASIFGAYGITDDVNVNLSLPYIISDDRRDFQDISLLLKYRIYQYVIEKSRLEFSLAGGISTPVSNYELGGLNDIGQQATILETRGMVHYSHANGWFGTLQSGFSFKLAETPNSIPFTFKFGKASEKWYYDLYYDFQHSFGGIDYRGTPRPQNFKEFGSDFHKVGGTVFTSFSNRFGSYLSLSYVISGRNVFAGPSYGLGLVYDFRIK